MSKGKCRLVPLAPFAPRDYLRGGYLFAKLEQMPNRTFLGELELMVLLAVVRLGDGAYGVPISKELRTLAGREVALGSIYAALDRIEQKGHVTSRLGDPTPERGGRAKRYFRATPAGIRALRTTRAALTNLWNGIPQLEGGRS
jgi:PadR family transcriptional regulator, regulatory protein PadR